MRAEGLVQSHHGACTLTKPHIGECCICGPGSAVCGRSCPATILPPFGPACCVDDDGPFEVDEDGYCIGCGTRRLPSPGDRLHVWPGARLPGIEPREAVALTGPVPFGGTDCVRVEYLSGRRVGGTDYIALTHAIVIGVQMDAKSVATRQAFDPAGEPDPALRKGHEGSSA